MVADRANVSRPADAGPSLRSVSLQMMKRTVLTCVVASAGLLGCRDDVTSPTPAAPLLSADAIPTVAPGAVVPGQYVVLYRRERVALAAGVAITAIDRGAHAADLLSASTRLTTRKLAARGGVLRRTFGYAVHGFAAQLSDSAIAALRADPDVALVEPDHVMHISGSGVESSAPWGLDRIDQAQLPLDGLYHYGNDGTGTSVYIVDTGINFAHVEFGGRAVTGRDFVTTNGTAADCHGHGTHVAGTVGGATYGVAKNVRLIAARVLDCSGSGSESGVIAALDWVAQQKGSAPATPMVVNMSLGGDAADALDSAVARTVAAGVTVVVAAGNSAADACTASPARAASAITVGATDASDSFASFSNYGSCVDISAPGVRIVSAYIGSTTATAMLSGTSMATPHVAGAAALYLSAHPTAAPAEVVAALTANASTGTITALPANTPSRIVDVAFVGTALPAPTGPTTATLVIRATGACLTLPGSGVGNALLVTAACGASASGQQWTVQAVGTSGTITAYSGAVCMDDYGGNGQAGDGVGTWTCHGQSNQRWTLTSVGTIVGINGLCLTAPAAVGAGSATLQTCAGTAGQGWTLVAATTTPVTGSRYTAAVTNSSTGLCIDVAGGSTTAGGRAIVWTCHGQINQQWSMPADGTSGVITVYNGTLCTDAFGGGGHVGDAIGTWTCNGGANQSWTLSSAGALQGYQRSVCRSERVGWPRQRPDVAVVRRERGAALDLDAGHLGKRYSRPSPRGLPVWLAPEDVRGYVARSCIHSSRPYRERRPGGACCPTAVTTQARRPRPLHPEISICTRSSKPRRSGSAPSPRSARETPCA